MVYSQKLIANSEEQSFRDKHYFDLIPDDCRDLEYDDDSDIINDIFNGFNERSFDEEDFDEETIKKIIAKHNGKLNKNDEEYDDIPCLDDIHLFFEDTTNKLYNNVFTDFYHTLYGIIDCEIKSAKQLVPFTDDIDKIYRIIRERNILEKRDNQCSLYGRGWNNDDTRFYGYILDNKFFYYPPRIKGLTIKYIYDFYPDQLKWMTDNDFILIPNRLLDTLENSELTRHIRLSQESHLSYSNILSISDCLLSTEYNGIVSSYQGKNINQIIHTKGGTKHLVGLLNSDRLIIDKDVLNYLKEESADDIEEKCYDILLSVIDAIESEKEEYEDWLQNQRDKAITEDSNREFNDMMNDFDAWGNID